MSQCCHTGEVYLGSAATLSTLSCSRGLEAKLRLLRDCRTPSGLQSIKHTRVTHHLHSQCHTCRSDTCRSDAWRRQFYLCSSLMLFASTDRFSSCGHMGAHCRTWPQTSRERHSSDTLILTWAAATVSVIIILSLNQSINQSIRCLDYKISEQDEKYWSVTSSNSFVHNSNTQFTVWEEKIHIYQQQSSDLMSSINWCSN